MTKRSSISGVVAALAVLGICVFAATAPEQINYQARVETQGVPFDGVGQFKFAIVDEAGTNTYWANDGTSVGGNEPSNAVSLNVKGGLLAVRLGDESYPNMTKIPASVFDQQDRHVRLWFGGKDGSSFEKLMPDNPLASVPYALMAQAVPDDSLSGKKFMRESVWPVHSGRDNTIVSYQASYTADTLVTVGTIPSNKNYIITDIVFGCNNGLTTSTDLEIRYTTNAVDTILFRQERSLWGDGTGAAQLTPVVMTLRSGLVVPAGATLKMGGYRATWAYPQSCTVGGFEIPVE